MSAVGFAVLFVLGAGSIALWVDHRFPSLTPAGLKPAFRRLLIALVLVQLLAPVALGVTPTLGSPAASFVNLFAIALPALTFMFLTVVWMIKNAQSLMRGSLR